MGDIRQFSAIEIADILGRPRPTDEQVAVIEAPLQPVLVVAGAGSGKTETMSARVVYLIANGMVEPDGVLGLTFTRKAAGELAERVRRRLRTLSARLRQVEPATAARIAPDGEEDLLRSMRRPNVSTYNSYAANLVGEHALRLGIEPGAKLLGEASQWQLANDIVETWAGDLETTSAVSTVVNAVREMAGSLSEHLTSVTDAKAGMRSIIDHITATPDAKTKPGPYSDVSKLLQLLEQRIELLDLVDEYNRRKRLTESLDFADQVAFAAHLAATFPEVGQAERTRFPVVLLDEYQDTSYAQARMLGQLFGDGHAVTAVGDPHQSIYGWRGASASGLSRFAEQFGNRGRVHNLSLSTSWRNDKVILDLANTIAAPLRAEQVGIDVAELEPRPGAGPGAVHAQVLATEAEEAQAVADFIEEHWRAGETEAERVTAAVLCRARSQFLGVEVALRARGIPVEVVGLGGLLNEPEVVDIVALLQVLHDPSRGDSLMRLLTGPQLNIGAADLFAIADRARELAHRQGLPARTDTTAQEDGGLIRESDITDAHSIIDVLDDLPAPDWVSRDGRSLSAAARKRLADLTDLLTQLRSRTYLSVPELVREAEKALGLDIESGLGGTSLAQAHRARANLDALAHVATSFADSTTAPTLGAFLAWLDAADSEERGLDQPLTEPDPNAVSIITVHAAKGLEWDVVAIPGLVDGRFPSIKTTGSDAPKDNAWFSGLGTLPYPLRGDYPDLPAFEYRGAQDHKELEDRRKQFCRDAGQYQVTEERRLAYVAFTRARSKLLLTGSWFRGTAIKPSQPSLFLAELVAEGFFTDTEWAAEPDKDATNPALDQVRTGNWPQMGPAHKNQAVDQEAAELVLDALTSPAGARSTTPEPHYGRPLAEITDLLLAERDHGRNPNTAVEIPAHVSASALVRMAADRQQYALDLRRPIPSRPSVHAHRGTVFHLWVEHFFSTPTLMEFDDLPAADEFDEDFDLAALQETFRSSEWPGRDPVAIEVDIETPIAGRSARSRIDAVFADPLNPGGFVVVDWKTGREPSDPDAIRAREVQLAVYRLAWSRWKDIPIEQVDAAFFYVGSGTTVRPQQLMDEHDLEALIRG